MSTLDVKAYIHSTVNPILEPMIAALLGERPDDAAQWMYNYLGKKVGGGASSSEVAELKAEIARLKKQIGSSGLGDAPKDGYSDSEDDTDDEDDYEPVAELPNFPKPSDNYLRKPRASVSAEVYGMFNQKKEFKPPVFPKSTEQMQRLKKIMSNSFMFANLEPRDLDTVCLAMQEKALPDHEKIIKQGDDGDCLYIVEQGGLECWKDFHDGKGEIMVKKLSIGDVFGELALLYSVPRAASVVSVSQCIVWSLDRQTFNAIVKDAASKRRNLYESVLRKVKALESLDDYDRSKLIDALKPEFYKNGEYIMREGDDGDVLYIVEEGTCYAEKNINGKVTRVYDYKDGDFFGELALIKQDKRAASVVASSDVKVLGVDRKTFKRLLGSIEDIMAKRTMEYEAINRAAAGL